MPAKILPITNDDLYRVLAGRTMTVRTKDGEDIALRLYTPQELLLAVKEVGMTQEQAENLTRTHDLYELAEQMRGSY